MNAGSLIKLGSLGLLGFAVYSIATGEKSRGYLMGAGALALFIVGAKVGPSNLFVQGQPPPPPPPGTVDASGPGPTYLQAHPDVAAAIARMAPAQQKVEYAEVAANTGPGHF